MPTISQFYGILVQMYYDDHALHQQELMEDWKRREDRAQLQMIPPLA